VKGNGMSGHAEEISAILMEKVKAYGEFQSVTGLLLRALENDEMVEVVRFIERREELMRNIDGLDRRIDRYRHSAPSDKNPVNIRLMGRISDELAEILKRIMTADCCCYTTAASKCEEARKELMLVRKKKVGIQGYALKTQRIPKFLNVQT
jgi:hypothetical protein